MNGPHVEEVECWFCPCGDTYYVARCCTALEQGRNSTMGYRRTATDAHLDLANHLRSVHGINHVPAPVDHDDPAPVDVPTLFEAS